MKCTMGCSNNFSSSIFFKHLQFNFLLRTCLSYFSFPNFFLFVFTSIIVVTACKKMFVNGFFFFACKADERKTIKTMCFKFKEKNLYKTCLICLYLLQPCKVTFFLCFYYWTNVPFSIIFFICNFFLQSFEILL